MLEWHAQSRGVRDTWFRGRFLEEWADPRALRELEGAFARYDSEDVWRALIATMDLFGWVARETARNASLSYPDIAEKKVRALVDEHTKRETTHRDAAVEHDFDAFDLPPARE
jgi:hypothetical protein